MREKYSPTTIADTIAALQAVIAWAVRREILTANPLAGYAKPSRRSRTRVMTDDEFAYLLAAASPNRPFGRLLVAMRYTGCRPAEVRELRWSDVRLDDGLWILTKHKTITQQRDPAPRIIPLSRSAMMLCRLLALAKPKPSAYVFLNEGGKPWSKDAICRAMARCAERAGLGKDVVPYTNRHTYGTNAVGKVDPFELAGLMGHTSIRTTQRYVHLSADRLKDAQDKVSGDQPK
jgi:integrase/recombinase XerD